jgi:hypothetical protein
VVWNLTNNYGEQKMLEETKKCPYCAETIKAEAVVCRFCGRDLAIANSPQQQSAATQEPKTQPRKQKKNFALVLVVSIVGICILLWAITQTGPKSSSSYTYYAGTASGNSSLNTVYAKDFVYIPKDDWGCSHDSIGNMIFEGKVKNTSGTYNLQFVELRATVLTESFEVINTNTGYIDSDVLSANSSSTFKIYVDDPSNKGKHCKIEVEDASFK